MPTITPIPADLRPLLARLCGQYQADETVIAAMVDIESGWNPNAVGDDGHSIGLLQLHDAGLGANMSVSARQDPETNLRTGIRAHVAYLREFGSIEAAIAAHNAGGPAVRDVNGDWEALYGGTVASRYVRPVLAHAERYRDELAEANGIDPDILRIQLDAIWGVSERLLAGRADREAWLLRQAVIAIKDEVHLH